MRTPVQTTSLSHVHAGLQQPYDGANASSSAKSPVDAAGLQVMSRRLQPGSVNRVHAGIQPLDHSAEGFHQVIFSQVSTERWRLQSRQLPVVFFQLRILFDLPLEMLVIQGHAAVLEPALRHCRRYCASCQRAMVMRDKHTTISCIHQAASNCCRQANLLMGQAKDAGIPGTHIVPWIVVSVTSHLRHTLAMLACISAMCSSGMADRISGTCKHNQQCQHTACVKLMQAVYQRFLLRLLYADLKLPRDGAKEPNW